MYSIINRVYVQNDEADEEKQISLTFDIVWINIDTYNFYCIS